MRQSVKAYMSSIAVVGLAVALRYLFDPVLRDSMPMVTLFGAIAAAVWIAGVGPGVLTAILGFLAGHLLFMSPRGVLQLSTTPDLVVLVAYGITSGLIVSVGGAMRRARDRALHRGELLHVTLASIGDAVITSDPEGRVTFLNAPAETLTGWSSADAVGRPLDEVLKLVDEADGRVLECPATRALRTRSVTTLTGDVSLVRRDGTRRPVEDSASPIRDRNGWVSGSVVVFRDVAERRRLERAEARADELTRLLASIVASSNDAIIGKSLDGTIRSWNGAAERIFGYTAAEAVGAHISLILPPDRVQEEALCINGGAAVGRRLEHFETERLHRDGRRIPVTLTVSPIHDDAGKVVGASAIVRDVSERNEAEAELQKFVRLVENSTDFIGICDLFGVPSYVNPAGLKMVGLDGMEEARRVTVRDFFLPEDQPRVTDELFPIVMADGHAEIEVPFRNFRTGDTRWMAYKVIALRDSSGHTTGFATVSQDISERRRMEGTLRSLAAELSERDRRKDEFLATLAHELRNPLAPLSNAVHLLQRGGARDEDFVRRMTDNMDRQVRQLVRLVDDLLDVSRITHGILELRKERTELAAILEQALQASTPLAARKHHQIHVNLPDQRIFLQADTARLIQVFANLLNNSCKYTPPNGHIHVRAQCEATFVDISVEDDGIGIPREQLQCIFEPFVQLDRSNEKSHGGMGIGLALVKRLVHMHGGSVEASSPGLGKGSRFVVRLPVSEYLDTPAPGARIRDRPTVDPVTARRILVVDDNRDAADSLAMLLEASGHAVTTAYDGARALAVAAEFEPDIALLDIGMPGMDGHEVCRRLRTLPRGEGISIMALTGWGQQADRVKSQKAGFDFHLTKPVDFNALTALLASTSVARTVPELSR